MRVTGLRALLPLVLLVIGVILATVTVLDEPAKMPVRGPRPPPEVDRTPRRRPLAPPVEEPETSRAAIFGTIRGEPNPLAPGAWLAVSWTRGESRTTLAPDGAFRVTGLPTGEPLSLWVGPGTEGNALLCAMDSLTLKPGEVRTLDLVVALPARVCGRVLDGEGRPVAGARIAVLPPAADWRESHIRVAAETGRDGRFFVGIGRGRRAGPVRLVVDAVRQGYVLEERVLDPGELEVGTEIEIRLTMGEKIAGVALGPEGRPIAGATVHLLEQGKLDPMVRRPVEGRVTTDAEGRFTDSAYRPGVYRISLTGRTGDEEIALVVYGIRSGREDVVLRFPGFGSFSYRFVDDRTNEGVSISEGAIEYVFGHEHDAEDYVTWRRLPGRSRGTLLKLPQGHYRIWAVDPDHRPFRSELFYVAAGETGRPVTFRLTPR